MSYYYEIEDETLVLYWKNELIDKSVQSGEISRNKGLPTGLCEAAWVDILSKSDSLTLDQFIERSVAIQTKDFVEK